MKLLAFIVGLLLTVSTFAQTVVNPKAAVIAWPIPPKYADGTLMPVTDVAFVTITWAIVGTDVSGTINTPITPPTLTIPTPCGQYVIKGSFTTTAKAHVPSTTSNIAVATYDSGIKCPIPVPPGAFVVL